MSKLTRESSLSLTKEYSRSHSKKKIENTKKNGTNMNSFISCEGSSFGVSNSSRSSKQSMSSGYYSMLPSARDRIENQHVFINCYKYLCEVNNSVPKVKVQQDHVLEFFGDRIRMEDWLPIIKAVEQDQSLKEIKIFNRNLSHPGFTKDPALYKKTVVNNLVLAIQRCLSVTKELTLLHLESIPFSISNLKVLCLGLKENSSLRHLSLTHCKFGDQGCEMVCRTLRYQTNIRHIDLSGCNITPESASNISQLIQIQKLIRYGDFWKQSLRYRPPNINSENGLCSISLNDNKCLGDSGFSIIANSLFDDLWISEIRCRNCDLTNESAELAVNLIKNNFYIQYIDLRNNYLVDVDLINKLESLSNKSNLLSQKTCNSDEVISDKCILKTSSIISSNRSKSCCNQSSSKRTCCLSGETSHMNLELQVPPLKLTSIHKNNRAQKDLPGKQKRLSETEKLKKSLQEANARLHEEISKRIAAETHCNQLEIQLKEIQRDYVLVEKLLFENLVKVFTEFSRSVKDIKLLLLKQFDTNIEVPVSNLQGSQTKDTIQNSTERAVSNEHCDNTNLNKLRNSISQNERANINLISDPVLRAQAIFQELLKQNHFSSIK